MLHDKNLRVLFKGQLLMYYKNIKEISQEETIWVTDMTIIHTMTAIVKDLIVTVITELMDTVLIVPELLQQSVLSLQF